MEIVLKSVLKDEKEILKNLLEKYSYEFSQWDQQEINALGLYGYDYLDCYWTEENRWAYFILVDGKLAGFAMVNDYPECGKKTDYVIAEFFVLYQYRRKGVGKAAVFQLFDQFHGTWQLKRHPLNLASVYFWDCVIDEYTGGKFHLAHSEPDHAYADGTVADIFFFKT